MGAFRDTVVKQAVKLANETATAAAARAQAAAGAPPPPRPPSCADKYCIYLALRPMFEEGEGLCICTFSYLAPAAAAARVGRAAMLLALAGALMMAGGFGALSQRASYWLGVRERRRREREKREFFFLSFDEKKVHKNSLSFPKPNSIKQVTAPASERARVAEGLFGGEEGEEEGGRGGDEEGALRPKGPAASSRQLSLGPKAAGATSSAAAAAAAAAPAAAATSIHVSASAEGQQQQSHPPVPPPRRTGSGGRVRSFFTGLSNSPRRAG